MTTFQIQQSENVGQFQKVTNELNEIMKQNGEFKNKIVNQIDDIIRTLNGDTSDYSIIITTLENFLKKYKDFKPFEGTNNKCVANSVTYQKKVLIDQNKILKEILMKQKDYNLQISIVNQEYSDNIDKLITLVQERKFKLEQARCRELEQIHRNIEIKRKEEFKAYEKKLANEMIIFKLNQIIVDFFKTFDKNKANEEICSRLNYTLQYYQKLFTKKDELYHDKSTLRSAFKNSLP